MTVTIVSAKGWVVIPKDIRDRFGIMQGTRVRFVEYGNLIGLMPEIDDPIEALYGMFADEPSLTDDLLREHAEEIAKEEGEIERFLRSR